MAEFENQNEEIKAEEMKPEDVKAAETQEENDKPVTYLLYGLGFGCLGAILLPLIGLLIFMFLIMKFF